MTNLELGSRVRIRQEHWNEFNSLFKTYSGDGNYILESVIGDTIANIEETVPRKAKYSVPLDWVGPDDIWKDILKGRDGFLELNGNFNFHQGHHSGGTELANVSEFYKFLGKEVHITHRAGNSGYGENPLVAEIVKEKLYYKHPDCLEDADGTSIHTVMGLDGTRHWVISGYTEGGYCEWSAYLEDLDNFLTEFKKERKFND